MTNRLVILTNIPTPYRIPFFNALDVALRRCDAELGVLFCAGTEPNRQWNICLDDQQYWWKILPGLHPSLRSLYPHFNPTVVRELHRLNPTWLLVAGAWNTPTMLLAQIRWFASGARRIQWSEGHADAVLHPTGPIAKVRRQLLARFDGFAVPNGRSEAYIRSEVGFKAPVLRLPNTVDDALFGAAPSASQAAVRAAFGLPVDRLLVTTVAQLEDRKGVCELVQGYYALSAEERKGLALALIGEGSLKQQLQRRIEAEASSDVHLLGHLDQTQVRDVLASSDAFLLPTKQDPNPLSVIEAAFAGLPLVVTKQAGNANDLIVDGENGYILESARVDHIANVLRLLMEKDTASLRRMGETSRVVAQRGFRRDIVAAAFVDALITSFPLHGIVA